MGNDKKKSRNSEKIITPREEKIAKAILMGAAIADIAAVNQISDQKCRAILHQYCKWSDREVYDDLNIDAAERNVGSPELSLLQKHKHYFIDVPPPRSPEVVNQDIRKVEAQTTQSELATRSSRAILHQLQAELESALLKAAARNKNNKYQGDK